MVWTVKKNKKYFIVQESTPWTAETLTLASEALNVNGSNSNIERVRETLENMEINHGINEGKFAVGMEGGNGTISTYMKANGTEGAKPEWSPLIEATLGATALTAATQNTDNTSQASTDTRIEFNAAPNFAVGQTLTFKIAGAYEDGTVATVGADYVTLDSALSGAPSDATPIAAVVTWNCSTEPKPFSLAVDIENGAGTEKISGGVVTGLTLSSATVKTQAFLDFAIESLTYDRDLADLGIGDATYDTATSPVISGACLKNCVTGDVYDFSEFTFNIENTWAVITDACDEKGKVAMKLVGRKVNGSFNPHKVTNSLTHWTNYDTNATYSLCITFKVPTATGEYGDSISINIPNVQTANLTEGDDGVLKDNVEFNGFVTGTNSTDKDLVYISAS